MSKKRKAIVVILIIIAILLIVFIGMLLGGKFIYSKYNPPLPDGEKTQSVEKSNNGGSVAMEYSNQVEIDLNLNKVNLYFKNPIKSKKLISLELLVNNESLALSKKMKPGEEIKQLTLNKQIEKGKYNGIFKLKYYELESEKENIVDSEINVKINVK